MKVHYSVPMDGAGQIGEAIPKRTRGDAAAAVSYKIQTKTAEVHICKTNSLDEVLSTVESFERAQKVTKMSWLDAAYNFSNCLGQVPQTRLDIMCLDYPETEDGFKQMIKDFIRDLCLGKNAKGTL